MVRTDLAVESDVFLKNTPIGIEQTINDEGDIKIIQIDVLNETGAKKIGRPQGRYITFETNSILSFEETEHEKEIFARELKKLIPKDGFILVVGLGNENITPDAIGPKVANNVFATRHFHQSVNTPKELSSLRQVSVIHPGVLGQTGIESSEIALSLCKHLNPVSVIVIDALASRSIDRLGTTIQLSNCGISPGSGVQNTRKELSYRTLGIPVISIGVPTVVDMETIAKDYCKGEISKRSNNMMVTPRDIDRLIERSSSILSDGINLALFPTLSLDFIQSLNSN